MIARNLLSILIIVLLGMGLCASQSAETKEYDSGVIYVIDRVLLPKNSEVAGVVETANDLGAKKFAAAVKAAGLADQLNGQGLLGIASLSKGPFTVFAPDDAAFNNAKASVDAINKKEGGMRALLSYHMIEASALQNRTDPGSVKTCRETLWPSMKPQVWWEEPGSLGPRGTTTASSMSSIRCSYRSG